MSHTKRPVRRPSWLSLLFGRPPSRALRRQRPTLEALEERCTPAIVVNSLADGPIDHSNDVSVLTLREAVDLANQSDQSDKIEFSVTGTIRLTQGQLTLSDTQ